MKTVGKMTLSTIITIALILVIAFCISGTVISQSKGQSRVEESFYQEVEQEYVREVRELLTTQGYNNSGVTMTRIIDENGIREYTVAIQHKYISKLEEEKKLELIKDCEEIVFPVENCNFCHEIFTEDM